MKNQAFATSGGYGTVMDEAGKFTHLFDPRTGGSQPRYKSMSVMAESAAVADAFLQRSPLWMRRPSVLRLKLKGTGLAGDAE